jgi:NADH-quinone oxidoreductase subunit I
VTGRAAKKRYWNEPRMGLRERIYIIEVLRGLNITGGVFLRNMWKWMTFRKGALTTYYPEERRSDYSPNNRGRHVLTQRANGEVQCVSCNLCATACPAYCIEILSSANVGESLRRRLQAAVGTRRLEFLDELGASQWGEQGGQK